MKGKLLAITALILSMSYALPVRAASEVKERALAEVLIAQNRDEYKNFEAINRIYREVLERDADYRGLKTWSRQLERGSSLRDIRKDIARSPEAKDKIRKIYAEVLGREADYMGLETWTEQLADGSSLRDVRKKIAESREAEDAINRIYQQVLGRNADRDGLRTWKRELAEGMTLRELRRKIASSEEGRQRRKR
ncbi:MAG: DUF4214 domain-containing protein [Oscillatoriaceae bacterium SKW80]|nr:DUF4214 domain-containing protein [Oscillatoriaceae bacterium SKYG93]MCX8120108.1 DUF4214 domain-containing protein [Oscillatoriaceae bacterium SKW80]MDW8453034.1 DUF4214 domain-containing protein [Oscillatoriaceae cyanobacterium SKYGB_i_bin93]